MVIVLVVISCGAVICAIGVVKKTRDFLHIQRLSNRDDDRADDATEHNVELENYTNNTEPTMNSERVQSIYQSQNQAHHPSAPPDSSMEGMPFIPHSTLGNTHSSAYLTVDQNSPPGSLTIDPPSYSEAIK